MLLLLFLIDDASTTLRLCAAVQCYLYLYLSDIQVGHLGGKP